MKTVPVKYNNIIVGEASVDDDGIIIGIINLNEYGEKTVSRLLNYPTEYGISSRSYGKLNDKKITNINPIELILFETKKNYGGPEPYPPDYIFTNY